MFTGIIEATGKILEKSEDGLEIARPSIFDDCTVGSSISISGVCLTITELDDKSMRFDVVDETLQKTTLGSLNPGDQINLERALRADARFEGHIVQGHVEGVAQVESLDQGILTVTVPSDLSPLIVEKGSIAIDGVSLTVAKKDGVQVSVALIPHTLENTTLGSLKDGDTVNIETDILGRYLLEETRYKERETNKFQ